MVPTKTPGLLKLLLNKILPSPFNIVPMMIDINLLLNSGGIRRKIEKTQTVFFQGEAACFYYQVERGRVKLISSGEGGKEFLQGIYTDGETFGELSLFDEGDYPASAVAEEDTTLIRLSKESFLQVLKGHPAIHFSFTRLLSERLRFNSMLLKELCCYAAEHQIFALIRHFKKLSKFPVDLTYKVDLTRQQIADMTGLRVETVIRAIRSLSVKGDLLLTKGKVYA